MPTLAEIKSKVIDVWENDGVVLPSVTAAQFILESAWGTSSLSKVANNYFGIKASSPWTGATHTISSNEEIDGVMKPKESVFRKYATWQDSVQDHSDFFVSTETRKKVYAGIIGETDYKKACNAMTGSYATDSSYGKKLIAIIEANRLAQWDVIEEETNMGYTIDYRIIDYTGRKTDSNKYVIAHESGNPNNVGANSLESEVKYMQGQAAQGGAFTSHWVGSGGRIIQIAPVGKIQYGAGGVANSKSYAQVELARTNNADTFKKDYAAYVWLLRTLAAECGIPQTLDKTGNGIKTHLWVTNNLGNTTHVDPYGYLNSWGISNAQFATDIANGLGVSYSAPAVASGPVRIQVAYDATITSGGYSIDSMPWGEDGRVNWGTTDEQVGKAFYFYEENFSGEYANGKGLGWVDKRALTKGIIAQPTPSVPEPTVAPEPVVVASILYLPNGQDWVIYPPDGPYTAGDIISVEGPKADAGLYLTILGDRGNNIVIVELPNFGTVGIYFDPDKGAAIDKVYA